MFVLLLVIATLQSLAIAYLWIRQERFEKNVSRFVLTMGQTPLSVKLLKMGAVALALYLVVKKLGGKNESV